MKRIGHRGVTSIVLFAIKHNREENWIDILPTGAANYAINIIMMIYHSTELTSTESPSYLSIIEK